MRCGKITLALCVALASCMTMAEVGSAMGSGLRGERGVLLWCRDKANTWEGELVRGESPATSRSESGTKSRREPRHASILTFGSLGLEEPHAAQDRRRSTFSRFGKNGGR